MVPARRKSRRSSSKLALDRVVAISSPEFGRLHSDAPCDAKNRTLVWRPLAISCATFRSLRNGIPT
jgi:hypothetical protein